MKTIVVHAQAERIATRLAEARAGVEIAGTYENGDQGIEAICAQLPDLAILDIDLAGISALNGFGQHEQPLVEFVLLSEWATFAYEAFRFGATDFLLKPVQEPELLLALDRAAKRVHDKLLLRNTYPLIGNLFPRLRDHRIAVQTREAIDYISVRHIVRCEDGPSGCRIVLQGNRILELPGSLSQIEPQLRRYPFQRVNDRCVVNLHHVERYKHRESLVILRDGAEVAVAGTLCAEMLRRLEQGER